MADRPDVKTRRLTREKLAKFLPNHETIKAFENITEDLADTLPDAISGVAENADTVLAVDAFRRRAPVPAAIAQDGTDAGAILAGDAFRRRAPPHTVVGRESDASSILATQIFGA